MEELRFHPLAKLELRDAILYYKSVYEELGLDFQRRVKAATDVIFQAPDRWRVREHVYRRINLARFPYYLPYIIEGSVIWILAVSHAKRKPEYWAERIEDVGH